MGVAGGIAGTVMSVGASPAVTMQMLGLMGAGTGIGLSVARQAEVTSLPQLVAAFHSLVGLAATFTALASFFESAHFDLMHSFSTYLAATIGALTVTGSLLAFCKLEGLMSGKPLQLPYQNSINAALAAGTLGGMLQFLADPAAGTGSL